MANERRLKIQIEIQLQHMNFKNWTIFLGLNIELIVPLEILILNAKNSKLLLRSS